MRRTRSVTIIALVVVTVSGGAFLLLRHRKQTGGVPPTATVSRRDLSATLTATGSVRAMVGAEVKVGARVSGRVEKLYANVGDDVRAGQLIALIDDREFRAAVDQRRADVVAAEAKWRQAVAAAAAQPQRTAAAVAEARSGVAAAGSLVQQAEVAARSQPVTTTSLIEQAQRSLAASQARLAQAKATAAAQPRTSQAQVDQAEAALRSAQAGLTRVKRGARNEEIAQAAASIRQAEAVLREDEANLGRAQTLYAKGYVSRQEVDRWRTARDVAEAEAEAARERLDLLKTQTLPEDLDKAQAEVERAQAALDEAKSAMVQVELRRGDVAAAEAEVRRAEAAIRAAEAGRSQDEIRQQEVAGARAGLGKAEASQRSALADTVQDQLLRRAADAARGQLVQAQAALQSAEAQLSYTRIAAPVSGTIASVTTQEGETVSAGLQAPTFVTIIDLRRLEVDAYVDETDIGKVRLGQQATFTVDAYPDKEFPGQVSAVYPKAFIEQNVVEYDVVIAIKDTGTLLKPDMTANVTIFAEEHPKVLSVPNKAIRREGGQKVVYVIEGGKAVPRPVKTGVRDTQYTEILSGVTEGAVVLVGGPEPPKGQTKTSGEAPATPKGM